MLLPDLLSGQAYNIQIRSTDSAGNTVTSDVVSVTTSSLADVEAPTFESSATVDKVLDSALTLSWTTDDYSRGEVECLDFNRDITYSTASEGLRLQHSLAIEGLDSGTEYRCRAVASDVTGNVAFGEFLPVMTTGEIADSDGDGIDDNAETDLGTDPTKADTDADGVLDGVDEFPLDATESRDTDSDGIGDEADTDDDGDSLPDEFEIC